MWRSVSSRCASTGSCRSLTEASMPHPLKYGSPFDQLRVSLADARRQEMSFDEAWSRAFSQATVRGARRLPGRVTLAHQTAARHEWLETFNSTREAWRRAYNGEPDRVSVVLAALFAVLVEDRSESAAHAGDGQVRAARFAQEYVVPGASRSDRRRVAA